MLVNLLSLNRFLNTMDEISCFPYQKPYLQCEYSWKICRSSFFFLIKKAVLFVRIFGVICSIHIFWMEKFDESIRLEFCQTAFQKKTKVILILWKNFLLKNIKYYIISSATSPKMLLRQNFNVSYHHGYFWCIGGPHVF